MILAARPVSNMGSFDRIASDRRSGAHSIREDVLAFDVFAVPATYAMARSVLLQRTDDAFYQLRVLVDSRAGSLGDLETWPLF